MSYFLNKCRNNPNLLKKTDELGDCYAFLILGRGEDVFFQKNNHSLFCSMDAAESVLFVKSIKSWEDSSEKIGKYEQKELAQKIRVIYEHFYDKKLKFEPEFGR